MKLEELDTHCVNCPNDLMSLCDRYTPANSIKIPICCFEEFKDLDAEKDIDKITEYCEENLEEWTEEAYETVDFICDYNCEHCSEEKCIKN